MKKRLVLVIAALLLGVTASISAYIYLTTSDPEDAIQETLQVVVAVEEIGPKERIRIDQVKLEEVPVDLAHFQAAQDFDQVVGYFAKETILAGEQILQPRLIKGFADYGIVVKIPAGHRAVSIPVDGIVGVAGFIRPGDRVDILVGYDEMEMGANEAMILLERIQVLAVDQEMAEDQRDPVLGETITVAVTPEQAEKLALALDHGVVRLALRPLESPETDGSTLTTVAKRENKTSNPKPTSSSTGLSQLSSPPPPRPVEKVSTPSVQKTEEKKTTVVSVTPIQEESKQDVQQEPAIEVKTDEPREQKVEIIRGTKRTLVIVEDE